MTQHFIKPFISEAYFANLSFPIAPKVIVFMKPPTSQANR